MFWPGSECQWGVKKVVTEKIVLINTNLEISASIIRSFLSTLGHFWPPLGIILPHPGKNQGDFKNIFDGKDSAHQQQSK